MTVPKTSQAQDIPITQPGQGNVAIVDKMLTQVLCSWTAHAGSAIRKQVKRCPLSLLGYQLTAKGHRGNLRSGQANSNGRDVSVEVFYSNMTRMTNMSNMSIIKEQYNPRHRYQSQCSMFLQTEA